MPVLLLALSTTSVAFGAEWATNYGGRAGASAYTQATAVDTSGNVYLTGSFDGPTFTLGNMTLNKIGIRDAFIAKLDATGAVLWVKNFGGGGAMANCMSIAVDSSGNIYLGGNFYNTNLTTPALMKIGTNDAFAIKLDSTGAIIWAKNFGGNGANAGVNGIAVDNSGNVYLGGYFNTVSLTTPALTIIGSTDAFAIKLDSTGAVTWAKNFGGSGAYAYGQSIAVDGSGNVYLGGYFNTVFFSLTTPALTKIGTNDAFAIKLSSTGATTWAKNFGGSGASAIGQSIAVDGTGNVYLGGYFAYSNLTTPALTKIGTNDAFVIKLSATGATTWAKNFGGSGATAAGQSIAVDGTGNVYLGGYFATVNLTTPVLMKIGNYDAFAIKLSPTGAITWAKNFGGSGANALVNGIAVDGSGNVYLGGYFTYANLTTPALTKIGTNDTIVLKLDSTGVAIWAKNFGTLSPGYEYLYSTTIDASGDVYITGYFDAMYFTLGSVTLTRIGRQDVFVAKVDTSGSVLWAKNFGGSGASAQGISVTADGSGNVYLGGTLAAANLTTPALIKIGPADAFAIKLDSTGAITWAKNFGGSGANALVNGIAVDGSGNVYLGGQFDHANLTTPVLTKIGNYDAFAIKLDSSGAFTWAKNFGGSGADAYGQSIAVDGSGNVYLSGYFINADLTTPALTKIGAYDAFALKFDSTGSFIWSKNFGGSGAIAYGTGIAVDASGNVYLGGYFSNANLTTPALMKIGIQDAYALKLDSTGAFAWARNFGGSGAYAHGSGIAVDGSGNVYLGGYFTAANLTAPALTKIGPSDAFSLMLDPSGTATWGKNFGGSGAYVQGSGIAVDGSGNVYLGGYFTTANLTTPALTKIGGQDAFIIVTTPTNTLTYIAGANGSLIGASPQTVSYKGSGSLVTAVPDANYHFVNWTGSGAFVTTTNNPLTLANVTSSMTITANFTHDAVNGACGSSNSQTFITAPVANLCSEGTTTGTSGTGPWTWTCSGQYSGTDASCSANLQAYSVTASGDSNGTISPLIALVSHGSTTTFTVTPHAGYHPSVSGCGGSLTGDIYTTGAITDVCTVNATFTNSAPGAPTLHSPALGSEVTTILPMLRVNAQTDPDSDVVQYLFEVYSSPTLTSGSLITSAMTTSTDWTVDVALADNATYYWRSQATDGTANSNWMGTANFFVNTANDAPTGLGISSPSDNTVVTLLTPVLSVTNAVDPDNDVLTYDFEVASDSGFGNIISSVTATAQGTGGTTSFTTSTLEDNTLYSWRVKARDEHGAYSNEVTAAFFVNTANDAPTAPAISSPGNAMEVTTLTPVITIMNSTDLDHDSLSYLFEIDSVNTFNSADKQISGFIAQGTGNTSWIPLTLVDNTFYYWRAKANDGQTDSAWTMGSFFVNTANDAPSAPPLNNPSDDGEATVLAPTLKVNGSIDIDNDVLTYEYAVYSDSGLTSIVTSTTGAGADWIITANLSDNTRYWWRARARDEHGLAGDWMTAASFFVNDNGTNDPPSMTITAPAATEPLQYGPNYTIHWTDSDPDSDAVITLGYDTTRTGCSGTQIGTGISENDPANSYTWDITSLPEGVYYLYGSISDGTTTLCAYGAGPITKLDKTLGDLNGDGAVDVLDALRAFRIAAGITPATPQDLMRGDVAPIQNGQPTRDSHIDIGDALAVLRRSVGLVTW